MPPFSRAHFAISPSWWTKGSLVKAPSLRRQVRKRADNASALLFAAGSRKQEPGLASVYGLTCMLFTTEFTPLISRATWAALSASAWLLTLPLRVTTPS